MSRSLASSLLLSAMPSLLGAQDSPPRRLSPTPIPLTVKLATISGVHELRDGRLIVTDGKNAGVYVVDPSKNAMTQLGSVGGDELQYTQPGGFYAAPGDTVFLLDRGVAKFLVLSPSGAIVGSRSIKRRGVTESSSVDVDRQRLDARGRAYFVIRGMFSLRQPGSSGGDSVALVRFDAAKQHAETVAFLRTHESKIVQASENMQITQVVSGSPMDEWGVASNGRVAIVRGSPYRVDWVEPNGRVRHGRPYSVTPIPFTQAEKDSITSSQQARASTGVVGGASTSGGSHPHYFADAKAPFTDNDVAVSFDGQVWVARSQPFGAENTIYDVFNADGERAERVQLAGHARAIGFSAKSVYVVVRGRGGEVSLAKYPR